jgi:hypothetical protein
MALDPVTETIDEQLDYVGIPDASIVPAIDGAQLTDMAVLGEENADF